MMRTVCAAFAGVLLASLFGWPSVLVLIVFVLWDMHNELSATAKPTRREPLRD